MSEPQDDLTNRIENGSYFKEARQWYDQLYIAPISQRIFFIVVTVIAGSILLMTLISLLNLLPLSPRVPFVYRNEKMIEETPRMERFKAANEEANPALIRYFLGEYVKRRESYNARKFMVNHRFIKNYSMPDEYREYAAEVDQNNPQSPIRRYGRFKEVQVTIRSIRYQREQAPFTAEIDFSTNVVDKREGQKSNWTATITFDYTDLISRDNYDEALDEYVLDFDEPRFMVLDYEKRERLTVNRR